MKDKNGFEIPNDSIIYGSLPNENKNHFWNFGRCQNNTSYEMIACTYGYVHDVKQSDLANMLFIGSLEDHKHLLDCD